MIVNALCISARRHTSKLHVRRDSPLTWSVLLFSLSLLKQAMQSNFDRRRINGPEESYPPIFDDEDETEPAWKPGQSRKGRAAGDIRPICMILAMHDFYFSTYLCWTPVC